MAQEIRQYLITYKDRYDGDHKETMPAYDLNEAVVQFQIKHRTKDHTISEIIPYMVIDETDPTKTEQKKEVHVKPNPVRKENILPHPPSAPKERHIFEGIAPKSPDTD